MELEMSVDGVLRFALGIVVASLLFYAVLLGVSGEGIQALVAGGLMVGGGVIVRSGRDARWMRYALLGCGALVIAVGVVRLLV
jgi:hypothetical protein